MCRKKRAAEREDTRCSLESGSLLRFIALWEPSETSKNLQGDWGVGKASAGSRQARAHDTENLIHSGSRFPHRLVQAPELILPQDLIDPGPVMGDSGEDSRWLCIPMSIGCNALGYPSTQEGSSRVSLLGKAQSGNA